MITDAPCYELNRALEALHTAVRTGQPQASYAQACSEAAEVVYRELCKLIDAGYSIAAYKDSVRRLRIGQIGKLKNTGFYYKSYPSVDGISDEDENCELVVISHFTLEK